MSFPQTASGVTAGLQTQYGAAVVENAAQAFWPVGFSRTSFGWLVVNANALAFDFTVVFQRPFALQFNFGGAQVVRPHGLDSFVSGLHDLETAQQAIPQGFESTKFGWHILNADALVFDFTEVLQRPFALQFNFGGGAQMASGVGGQDHLTLGAIDVDAPAWIQSVGWIDSATGWPIVSRYPFWTFDFTETGAFAPALQFNFGGGGLMLAPYGWESLDLGAVEVRNLAFAIYPESVPPSEIGWAKVLPETVLEFNFVALGNPALPIQFYFGDPNTRQFRPDGWDSFEPSPWNLVWLRPWTYLNPVGLNATQWGNNKVSPLIIYPQGRSLTQYGNAVIWREGEVQAIGQTSLVFGVAHVETDNLIRPVGLNATRWGLIHFEYIPLEDKQVDVVGFHPGGLGLEAVVSNWWREIAMPDAQRKTAYGTPFVAFRIRYLDVSQGINALQIGQFQVGFHQDVEMIGRDHSVFGEPETKIRHVYVFGLHSLTFGPPYDLRVSFGQHRILPRGYRPFQVGDHLVWNLTQVVRFRPLCPEPTLYDWCGTEWGQTHHLFVLNRNRHIYPYGAEMTRFEFRAALVLRAGRALLVRSLEKSNFGLWYERHQVAFYIRYFPFVGWDSFRMVTHHRIHNAAQAIYPVGFVATQFGLDLRHALWRWLLHKGQRLDEAGVPWVSRSPRYVQVFSNRASSRFSYPFVDFGQRYIAPEGRPPVYISWPILTQKPIPTITPRWQRNEYQFGRPAVKNVTPQLFVVGRSMFSSIPQYNWVSHSPRYLGVQSIGQLTGYGRPNVLFRDRTIYMWPHISSRVTQHLRVENVDPSPVLPTQQTVFMAGVCRNNSPGQGSCSGLGWPTLRGNSLYPVGFRSSQVGQPSFEHNAIKFNSWHANPLGHTQFGNASLNRPQRIFFGLFDTVAWGPNQGESYGIPPSSTPPKIRVSPHTIWARLDAPQQAVTNHGNVRFCEVDKFCAGGHPYGDGVGPWFGRINVRPEPGAKAGTAIVCGQGFSPQTWSCHRMFMRFGEANVENKKRVIPLEGWISPRFGFPRLTTPFTRTVRVYGSANTGAEFGVHWLGNKDRELFVSGVPPVQFGSTRIENFNREVYVVGLNATQWGNNNPMVHYPRTLTPYNNVLTQWGTTWVSHSPRWVNMIGEVLFITGWTSYRNRMRVWNRNGRIRGYGFSIMTEWGTAEVSQTQTGVSPYGIAAPCVSPHVTVSHV